MITVGIELNNVYRNLNKQILKYASKELNPLIEPTDCDDVNMYVSCDYVDVDKSHIHNLVNCKFSFATKSEKDRFMYIDYPLEIFGHAELMERNLDVKLNELVDKIGEDDIRFIFFSMDEIALSIQATSFFLSKTCSRLRKVIYPKTKDELWEECDVIVTSDYSLKYDKKPSFFERLFKKSAANKALVLINRRFNKKYVDEAKLSYDSLGEMLEDEAICSKIKKLCGK